MLTGHSLSIHTLANQVCIFRWLLINVFVLLAKWSTVRWGFFMINGTEQSVTEESQLLQLGSPKVFLINDSLLLHKAVAYNVLPFVAPYKWCHKGRCIYDFCGLRMHRFIVDRHRPIGKYDSIHRCQWTMSIYCISLILAFNFIFWINECFF